MSSELTMYSDDDRPLGVNSGSNGQLNGHVSYATNANGNGRHVPQSSEDSSMSEDDVPLLSQSSRVKAESETPKRPLKRKKVIDASSSDDDLPLASSSPVKQVRSATVPMPGAVSTTTVPAGAVNGSSKLSTRGARGQSTSRRYAESSEEDDDAPLGKGASTNGKTNGTNRKPPPKKRVKKEDQESSIFSDNSEDEKPVKRKRASKANGKAKKESDADDDKPLVPKSSKKRKSEPLSEVESKVKSRKRATKMDKDTPEAPLSPKKKGKKEEEEEEEVFKWWEQNPDGDGSIKWQTLEHNGVFFPPAYEPLPPDVKMKYADKVVDLPPESEEVAGFYAQLMETDHAQDPVFNRNFFNDWQKVLEKYPPKNKIKIEKFELCDFRPIFEYHEAEKARKKALSSTEKKALKAEREEAEEKYTFCFLDGRKEKVGNFKIEPPGLFRGRGEHPRKGALKHRVHPEDVTINIGAGVPIPTPNMPGKWNKVIHDQTVTWLANWTENVNGQHKYVFLAPGSSLKGQSDMQKFEKARELKKHVDRIRQDYNVDLRSKVMADRQRATAMYFIDKLALRAGNEKGEEEADTVGCCSLRCEHVTLEPPNFVVFDFLGKDSIRFYKRVEVDPQVFKNIRIFKNNKEDQDDLFDRVNTTMLNKHLQSCMKGLTAKVFRTYNASITFQEQLDLLTPRGDVSVQEKLNAYNKANRMVAILCNHQKSVSKNHSVSMEKMNDKLRAIKYERMKYRHTLFQMSSSYKKKKEYRDDESDLEEEWVAQYEDELREKEIEKAKRKFAKDNEKLEADGKKPKDEAVLQKRLEEVEEEFEQLMKERGTGLASLKRAKTEDKIVEAIEKLDERIKTHKLQMIDREEGKEVALGTSKINYLDPRITQAWCKQYNVPIEKIFSKSLLVKFPWAREVESDWVF